MQYRSLETVEELHLVADMEMAVWGMGPRDAVPMNIMRPITLYGGLVNGAWDGSRLAGVALAFPVRHSGRWVLWSHLAAVLPEYQGQGIGTGLKLAQRAWALEHGYSEIHWTFDPLQRGNANFNLHLLGATASVYHIEHYGVMQDAINRNSASDRVEARWKLNDPRVKALAEGRRKPQKNAGVPKAALLLRPGTDGLPVPCEPDAGSARLYAAVPASRARLSPDEDRAWRMALRETLTAAFARGCVATDLITEGGQSYYVLDTPRAWYLYVLECADGSLYTGITPDVARRLALHQRGKGAQYTRARRPVTLRAAWKFAGRVAALKAEAAFKSLPRARKQRLISREEPYSGAPKVALPPEHA